MNKFIEDIYNRSPIFIQNVFSSFYGAKLYRERYTASWRIYYDHLINTQFMSDKEINRIQIFLLKKLIRHAIDYVPYYQDTVKINRKELEQMVSLDILEELPVLDKSDLRESTENFISKYYNKNRLIKINTSGTTGTPLTIYVTPDARKMNYAFFTRSKQWAGLERFDRSITLAGRTIVPARQEKPPFWRKNLLLNNTLFSSYHLSEENLEHYVNKIREIKPIFIDSYPSSIALIADYMLGNNICDIKPKAIITSAETLFENQREKIESAFGCKVYDQYGSAEQVVFACQCERGSYHLNPEYGYLEVLDKHNKPVKKGELGEFVCTGFTNDAMPLIRYKIGDMGILSDENCDCGRIFPIIEKIYGRNDDILITPDGKYIGRLDPIFKGVDSTIKETQIIQEKLDSIRILIVKAPKYKDKHGEYIINELRKRMGQEVNYKISFVDYIPKTKSGKFRAVINRLKK